MWRFAGSLSYTTLTESPQPYSGTHATTIQVDAVSGSWPTANDNASAVWSHDSAVLMAARLAEVWGRLGLDPSRPLVQDQTQISFGEVLMALSESSDTVTVTRQ